MIKELSRAAEIIDGCNTVAVICHVNPDGDTLGAGLALFHVLEMYGKQPYIFCENAPSAKLAQALEGYEKVNSASIDRYDLAVAVDAAAEDRLGDKYALFASAKKTMCIDHHITNTRFADYNFIDGSAASTSEFIYELFAIMDGKKKCIDARVAKLLYTGIVADSGTFSFSSVSPHTHEVAGKLLGYGFDASGLIYDIVKKRSLSVYKLSSRVLSRATFRYSDSVGIISFRKSDFEETGTDSSDTEGIIVNIVNIDCVKIALALTEASETSYKVSIRTKEGADASAIALVFGGGGHARAAGCRISGRYEDVIDKLLKACRDELNIWE